MSPLSIQLFFADEIFVTRLFYFIPIRLILMINSQSLLLHINQRHWIHIESRNFQNNVANVYRHYWRRRIKKSVNSTRIIINDRSGLDNSTDTYKYREELRRIVYHTVLNRTESRLNRFYSDLFSIFPDHHQNEANLRSSHLSSHCQFKTNKNKRICRKSLIAAPTESTFEIRICEGNM